MSRLWFLYPMTSRKPVILLFIDGIWRTLEGEERVLRVPTSVHGCQPKREDLDALQQCDHAC